MYEPKKIKEKTYKICKTPFEVEQWLDALTSITEGQGVTIDEISFEGAEYYATFLIPVKQYKFFKEFIYNILKFNKLEEK